MVVDHHAAPQQLQEQLLRLAPVLHPRGSGPLQLSAYHMKPGRDAIAYVCVQCKMDAKYARCPAFSTSVTPMVGHRLAGIGLADVVNG